MGNNEEKKVSKEELKNVSGGCKKKYITVYCQKCGWQTNWKGTHFVGNVFAGPCPVCGEPYIYRK